MNNSSASFVYNSSDVLISAVLDGVNYENIVIPNNIVETIIGNSNVISGGSDFNGNVNGNNNTITLADTSGLSLNLSGTNNTVIFSGLPGFSLTTSDPTQVQVGNGVIRDGSVNGGLSTDTYFSTVGQITGTGTGFLGFSLTGPFSTYSTQLDSLSTAVKNTIPTDTPTGAINNSQLTASFVLLANVGQQGDGTGGDGSALGSNPNTIFISGGITITDAGQGLSNIASLWSSSVAAGYNRPFYEQILPGFNNVASALSLWNSPAGSTTLPLFAQVPISDLVAMALTTNPNSSFTDPLLLDLTATASMSRIWNGKEFCFAFLG